MLGIRDSDMTDPKLQTLLSKTVIFNALENSLVIAAELEN